MGIVSFLLGAGVGAFAMKLYMDKEVKECETHLHTEETENLVQKEEASHTDHVEITADGTIEVDPTDEEIIISTVKSLKKSNSRISQASIAKESGLSKYKVSKHKDLIESLKSK